MRPSSHATATAALAIAGALLWAAPAAAQETAADTAAAAAAAADTAAAAPRVTRAVVATGVQDREPVGEATRFSADVGTVYLYTVFEGDFPEGDFEHVWLRGDEEVARVTVHAAGPRWRTWSSKAIPADWTGAWTAKVIDGAGNELASVDFTVGGE